MPTLECPTCRAQVTYTQSAEIPYRPFCSKRCQLIDLGKWLNGEYSISEELPLDALPEEERPSPVPKPRIDFDD